ncbi:MAG TPA: hypothetical protein VF755_05555 [Catenuloplanes sp.]|jgi:hypothetical protein
MTAGGGAPVRSAPPQTEADRQAYLEGGLIGLACENCGVRVRVKKSSAQQTSVQWSPAGVRGCAEFAERTRLGEPSALVATCARLRDSIERAARDGRLPTPPEGDRRSGPT